MWRYHILLQKMGTRAAAFTAKIKNLNEIQMRLMQGSVPLPQVRIFTPTITTIAQRFIFPTIHSLYHNFYQIGTWNCQFFKVLFDNLIGCITWCTGKASNHDEVSRKRSRKIGFVSITRLQRSIFYPSSILGSHSSYSFRWIENMFCV